jgi:hypothetical protein
MRLPVPPLRPEPAIYSPLYELSLGKPATWNSPDIQVSWEPVFVGGQWQFPNVPNNAQYAIATLSDLSDVAAINTLVRISLATPGISFPATSPTGFMTQVITIPGNAGNSGNPKTPITIPLGPGMPLSTGGDLFIPPAIFVDIANPYDSNPNDNHGVKNTWISMLAPNSVSAANAILLINAAATPQAFNLAIIGPNLIGATLGQNRYVVPANASGYVILNFPAQAAGTKAEPTMVAKDDNGALLGYCTALLYFN